MFSWFNKPNVVNVVAKPADETSANIIARGTRIRGDIEGDLGFRIAGSVDGTIVSRGRVVVQEQGELLGNIRAESVTVLGRVEGDIVCEGHLEIGPNGRVIGDVTMKSVQVKSGGIFSGTSRMQLPAAARSLLPPKLATLPPPEYAAVPPQGAPTPVSSRARMIRGPETGKGASSSQSDELRLSGTDDGE